MATEPGEGAGSAAGVQLDPDMLEAIIQGVTERISQAGHTGSATGTDQDGTGQ